MSKFGWSYPPGAANDPYAPYNQREDPPERTTATNNVKKIFKYFGAKDWYTVYRALYNGTNCGATLSLVVQDYPQPVYNDNLRGHTVDAPVLEIHISSIVEGVDFGTQTSVVGVTKRGTRKTGNIVKQLLNAVDDVEKEASYIWNQTHGCSDCGLEEQGEWGHDAVNPECKSCKGQGIVI